MDTPNEQNTPNQRIIMCFCKNCKEVKPAWKPTGRVCVDCHNKTVAKSDNRSYSTVYRLKRKELEEKNRSLGLCVCGKELFFKSRCRQCGEAQKIRYERSRSKRNASCITPKE